MAEVQESYHAKGWGIARQLLSREKIDALIAVLERHEKDLGRPLASPEMLADGESTASNASTEAHEGS